MSNNNKNNPSTSLRTGLVPRLRFPEFVDSREWVVKRLGEVLYAENSTLTFNKLEFKENGYPVYGADSIVGCIDEFQHKEQYISIVKDGSGVGRLCLCNPKSSILGTLTALKLKDKTKFHLLCVYYLLNTLDFSSYIKGSGIPHIYYSDYKEHKVPFPSLPEQQKIAACLSSLDDLITAESQKLEVLQQHKKGLLQNLFPQEGETVPRLRFKEFEESGEWVVKRLGEVASFVNEKTQLENLSLHSYISTENLLPNYAGVTLAPKLPSSGNFTKYKKGDVLVSNIRPYLRKVWFAEKDGGCSNDVIVIRPNSLVLDEFLSLLLKNDAFISYIMKSAEGVKMPRGDKDSIKNYQIIFPESLPEQQKIAACLSSLDEFITAQRQKIEWLQQHKKGLLQGLFPDLITN